MSRISALVRDRRFRLTVAGVGFAALISLVSIAVVSRLPSPTETGTQTRGYPSEPPRSPTLSRAEAVLLVKFNISMMTRRYSADAIENTQTLQDVDIDTQAKVEYFKGRLAASLRANVGGSLDETRFQNALQLSTRSTVETVGSGLQRAYRVAWFAN